MSRRVQDESPSDEQLVLRAQGGDALAFGLLVERYQDRVYNVCRHMCRDDGDALDAVQTAFLKALENLSRFEARAGFYTWLYRIAVNEVLSQRRSRQRRPRLALVRDEAGDEREREPRDEASPTLMERVERREQLERLQQALSELDEEFRIAVVLKDIEELDYLQIASILGVPLGTVKSRIHRGRMLLRDRLFGEEHARDAAGA